MTLSKQLSAPSTLVAVHPEVQGEKFFLDQDVCTLGRTASCDIVVQNGAISRLHAKIERQGPRYVLYDTNSANGTFVNGRRLTEPHLLQDQDEIGLSSRECHLIFNDADPTIIPTFGFNLKYDPKLLIFSLDQQPLDLTPSEFRLLLHLYRHVGEVCTRESCATVVWSREYEPDLDDDALNRLISKLRQKLSAISSANEIIETRRGLGYVLNL